MKKKVLVLVSLAVLFVPVKTFAAPQVSIRKMADAIAKLLIAGRAIVAQNQDVINTHGAKVGEPVPPGAPKAFKGFIPAVFGRLVGQRFKQDTGISLKQTTLGKGQFGPRNPYNAPDAWERAQLTRFYEPSYPRGRGYGEEVTLNGQKVYRYIVPLYIEPACLKCHGDPATSPTGDGKDIAGRQMEGYKLGEIRGGISVTIPLQ